MLKLQGLRAKSRGEEEVLLSLVSDSKRNVPSFAHLFDGQMG